jgi:hypothetical protein
VYAVITCYNIGIPKTRIICGFGGTQNDIGSLIGY